MLRSEVLSVINSGEAWAFVGAGSSADAGLPGWSGLLSSVQASLVNKFPPSFRDEPVRRATEQGKLPLAFGLLEDAVGREALEKAVVEALPAVSQPGQLARLVADLPFAGYITTNYDALLESALSSSGAWVSVGNTEREIPKVSGDARELVWHLHGSQEQDTSKSRLILTDRDYDALYLESSPAMRQLQGLLAHRRVVFIGFSFADEEVLRLVKLVGRMTDVTRPAYAFVPAAGDFRHDIDRATFLRQYNVDCIPYPLSNGDHRALLDVLSVYSSLTVRRSTHLGGTRHRVPEYDPETTGLLIYNELVGRPELDPSVDQLRQGLTDSRILALLTEKDRSLDELVSDVEAFAKALGQRVQGVLGSEQARALVSDRYTALKDQGLLAGDTGAITLSTAGRERMQGFVARSELMRDQFRSSLLSRARSHADDPSAHRVADAAASFLDECVKRRSLGVAMALAVDRAEQHNYHMVALLQSLQTQLTTMADMAEARALVDTVQEALAGPTQAEEQYIGTALQASFGVHMLGFDQDTLRVRLRDLSETSFVLDATTLIPALACGSRGHQASAELLDQLRHRGCAMVTTGLLVTEVAEHARWAQRKISEAGSWQSASVLDALLGASGERSNDFLQGFIASLDTGECRGDFNAFLSNCFGGVDVRSGVTDAHVQRGLEALGVTVLLGVAQVDGFGHGDKISLDTYKTQITGRRQQNFTLTHARQVAAEAEALVLVEGLREGRFLIGRSEPATGAYFVSHSQFLNDITASALPTVLRQEAALQWLVALRGHGPEAAVAVYDGLLWELQERRADLVDKGLLRRLFKPTIDAAREELDAELERYRHHVVAGANVALSDVDELDTAKVLASATQQTTAKLQAKLAEAEARVYRLEHEREQRAQADALAKQQKKEKGAARYRRAQERRKGKK